MIPMRKESQTERTQPTAERNQNVIAIGKINDSRDCQQRTLAALMAPGGRSTRGNAYMAPITSLQWMPGMELKVSATNFAFFFSKSRVSCFSCFDEIEWNWHAVRLRIETGWCNAQSLKYQQQLNLKKTWLTFMNRSYDGSPGLGSLQTIAMAHWPRLGGHNFVETIFVNCPVKKGYVFWETLQMSNLTKIKGCLHPHVHEI